MDSFSVKRRKRIEEILHNAETELPVLQEAYKNAENEMHRIGGLLFKCKRNIERCKAELKRRDEGK
jgi:hypothetical protein